MNENEPQGYKREKEVEKNPQEIFTLTLMEFPNRETRIRVGINNLARVISALSNRFAIEIE